ncbi:MAG: radical SAM protein, partial [Deltaproteobacteria bacterium]|nr:radical SAM protein [Deltaproteobacteria bacterium]
TIFYEYAEDVSLAARERGLRNVFVTNGFIAEAPLRRLAPVMDAANVDLKCFSDETYRHHLGGRLQPVLDTLRRLVELEVWVEVTTLLVPGLNDGGEELDAVAGFLASLDPCIPWHVSRFHPDHRMTDRPRTSLETLERALDAGRRAGLRYVYPGNTPSHGGEHTCCHVCGEVLVEREGFSVRSCRIARGRCPGCLVALPGRFAR